VVRDGRAAPLGALGGNGRKLLPNEKPRASAVFARFWEVGSNASTLRACHATVEHVHIRANNGRIRGNLLFLLPMLPKIIKDIANISMFGWEAA
jgi:hypothetical protein